jgi:hypothetical protein
VHTFVRGRSCQGFMVVACFTTASRRGSTAKENSDIYSFRLRPGTNCCPILLFERAMGCWFVLASGSQPSYFIKHASIPRQVCSWIRQQVVGLRTSWNLVALNIVGAHAVWRSSTLRMVAQGCRVFVVGNEPRPAVSCHIGHWS